MALLITDLPGGRMPNPVNVGEAKDGMGTVWAVPRLVQGQWLTWGFQLRDARDNLRKQTNNPFKVLDEWGLNLPVMYCYDRDLQRFKVSPAHLKEERIKAAIKRAAPWKVGDLVRKRRGTRAVARIVEVLYKIGRGGKRVPVYRARQCVDRGKCYVFIREEHFTVTAAHWMKTNNRYRADAPRPYDMERIP